MWRVISIFALCLGLVSHAKAQSNASMAGDFVKAQQSQTLSGWSDFLRKYDGAPRSALMDVARKRVAELSRSDGDHPWLTLSGPDGTASPDDIRRIQQALGFAGFDLVVTGQMDIPTKTALQRMRRAHDLTPDPHLDEDTLRLLPDLPAINALKSPRARVQPKQTSPLEPRLDRALARFRDYDLRFGYFKGHLYIATLGQSSERGWTNAYDWATLAGGFLATITSPSEAHFLQSLIIRDRRFSQLAPDGSLIGPMIGLMRPNLQTPWRWVTDEPLTLTLWDPSQSANDHRFSRLVRPARPPKGDPRMIYWSAFDGRGTSFIVEIPPPDWARGP